jgi:hypothetical protein
MRFGTPLIGLLGFGCVLAPAASAAEVLIVVQKSALAGLRHYAGRDAWPEMRVGDRLALLREPDNPHDGGAIRVEWRGLKLGYLPQRDNVAAARQLDRGVPLEGRVVALRENRNRSLRLELEIVAPFAPP